jgi:GT2 family glycosyltransferase
VIDIIVPVFNAAPELRRCLDALKQDPPGDARLVLINDASTDAAIAPMLEAVSDALVLHNDVNLGFVGTVNRGMALSDNDVVLLNSDTVPAPGWLDEMRQCAQSDSRIGTVTPWSNNAEICSFPNWLSVNLEPQDLAELALRIRQAAPRALLELPTAVGFCMWIKRAALAAVGNFDAATFGRGYGEENDFCQRLLGHGWRHVLCDSAYVVHQGGASFSPLGMKPNGENYARLLARYPHYRAQIDAFIAADPIRTVRAELARRCEDLLMRNHE